MNELNYNQRDHSHCFESDSPPCGRKGSHPCCLCLIKPNELKKEPQGELKTFLEEPNNMNKLIKNFHCSEHGYVDFIPKCESCVRECVKMGTNKDWREYINELCAEWVDAHKGKGEVLIPDLRGIFEWKLKEERERTLELVLEKVKNTSWVAHHAEDISTIIESLK